MKTRLMATENHQRLMKMKSLWLANTPGTPGAKADVGSNIAKCCPMRSHNG